MKKRFSDIQDTFIAGLVFLLPLIILLVLITKLLQFFKGFTTKIAGMFGLKSFGGVSGSTIIGAVGIILLCVLCGYLVKISFLKSVSKWVNKKMITNLPGYAAYHEMALSKLEPKEEILPYECAAWIDIDHMQQPCFLMEIMPDGRYVVFLPTAGNVKEGTVFLLPAEKVRLSRDTDMKAFRMAVGNLGLGFAKQAAPISA